MHATERQSAIVTAVRERGLCGVGDLAERLHVSDETIRRDIRRLAARGLVRKVHGGVALPEPLRESAFRQRMDEHAEAKRAIAEATAGLIENGESVMLDTGTTTAYVARALTGHRDLLVATNCADIARTLASRNGNRVYIAGGEIRADDGAVLGHEAIRFVERFQVHTAILSIAAVDLEAGLMDYYVDEAEFSSAVIRHAQRAVVVADHAKINRRAPVRVAGFEDIDVLVTDQQVPLDYARVLETAGVNLIVTG